MSENEKWAVLNVSGERTTGTAPYYGHVVSLHETRVTAEHALSQHADHYDRHAWAVGDVEVAVVGTRTRYVR